MQKIVSCCEYSISASALELGTLRASYQREEKHTHMLWYTWVFLVVAILAGLLGFGGVAAAAAGIAKICFVVFLVLFLISLVSGRRSAI
jgi:uncharacterized membrane protein YtjA (UPF0391 family)